MAHRRRAVGFAAGLSWRPRSGPRRSAAPDPTLPPPRRLRCCARRTLPSLHRRGHRRRHQGWQAPTAAADAPTDPCAACAAPVPGTGRVCGAGRGYPDARRPPHHIHHGGAGTCKARLRPVFFPSARDRRMEEEGGGGPICGGRGQQSTAVHAGKGWRGDSARPRVVCWAAGVGGGGEGLTRAGHPLHPLRWPRPRLGAWVHGGQPPPDRVVGRSHPVSVNKAWQGCKGGGRGPSWAAGG